MPVPIVDVATPILQAYFEGKRLRMAQDQLAQAQANKEAERQQRADEFKQTLEVHKHQNELMDQYHKMQVAEQNFQHANQLLEQRARQKELIRQHLQEWGAPQQIDTNAGTIQTPMGMMPTNVQNVPGIETGYGDIVSTQGIPRGGMRGEEIRQRAEEQRQQKEMTIAAMKQMADERNRVSTQNNELTNAVRMMGINNRQGQGQSGPTLRTNQNIDRIAGQIQSDPLYKQFENTSMAYKFFKQHAPDPAAPGINDMNLIYQWVRGLDNSTVRPTEYQTVTDVGIPKLQNLGLKFQRLANNTVILPPATRKAIIAEINNKYKTMKELYNKRIEAAYVRAKRFDNDLSRDEFNSMILGGTELSDTDIQKPKLPEGFQIVK